MKWTTFPDEFPMEIVAIGLDLLQRKPINMRKALLAVCNLEGYAGDRFLAPDASPIIVSGGAFMAAPMIPEDECIALLHACQAAHVVGGGLTVAAFPWQVIFLVVQMILDEIKKLIPIS